MQEIPKDAVPVIRRGEDGSMFINAPLFGALPRDMQQRIIKEMELDASRLGSPPAPPEPPEPPAPQDSVPVIRDALDLIGDLLRDVARAHANLAEREQAVAELRHQAATLMADAASEIHGRVRRSCAQPPIDSPPASTRAKPT